MSDTKLPAWLAEMWSHAKAELSVIPESVHARDKLRLLELAMAQHEALARYPQRQQMAPYVDRARRLWEGGE